MTSTVKQNVFCTYYNDPSDNKIANLYFNDPKIVFFLDEDSGVEDYDNEQAYCVGIAYEDYIICGCCGGIIELDMVVRLTVVNEWVDLNNYIALTKQGLI